MTVEEFNAEQVKSAMYLLGKIRAMRLTPGERQKLDDIYDQLQVLRNSITEPLSSSVKIKARRYHQEPDRIAA